MGRVKIPYYVVRNGKGFWQAKPHMKALGFHSVACGDDGPDAWARAQRAYEAWVSRDLNMAPTDKQYPRGSIGEAWERYRRTDEWAGKAKATRDEWDYAWLKFIEPVFGDVFPSTVQMEQISGLRKIAAAKVSQHAAHRVMKVWRAFWKVMAAMQLCVRDADPSLAIRNMAPKGRTETWTEGEVARLTKQAWRMGYKGLAAIIPVIWDTQFSPVDARTLRPAQRASDKTGTWFLTNRAKTDEEVVGTLTRRSVWLLDRYIADLGFDLHDDAQIFRNRSGQPYTKDKLAADFRFVREAVFPGDQRRLMDMRRSGAVEANAGEVKAETLSAKMANSISQSKKLQSTYLPKQVQTVRLADEARKRGRQRLRKNET